MSNPISSLPAPIAQLSDDNDPMVQAHKPKSSAVAPANVDAAYAQVTSKDSQITLSNKANSKDFAAPHEMDDETIASTATTLAGIYPDDAEVDLTAVMGEFIKFSQQQRTSARETRFTESNAQTKSLNASAKEIRDGASDRLTGAIVGGSLQIGSGLMQVSGGLSKAGKINDVADKAEKLDLAKENLGTQDKLLSSATKELDDATKELDAQKALVNKLPDTDKKIAELEARVGTLTQAKQAAETSRMAAADTVKDAQDQLRRADHALDNVGKKRAAFTEVSGGMGATARATQERQAAEHDAKKVELEADASVHGQASQTAADWSQQMLDASKQASNTLSSLEQSRSDTARNIARM